MYLQVAIFVYFVCTFTCVETTCESSCYGAIHMCTMMDHSSKQSYAVDINITCTNDSFAELVWAAPYLSDLNNNHFPILYMISHNTTGNITQCCILQSLYIHTLEPTGQMTIEYDIPLSDEIYYQFSACIHDNFIDFYIPNQVTATCGYNPTSETSNTLISSSSSSSVVSSKTFDNLFNISSSIIMYSPTTTSYTSKSHPLYSSQYSFETTLSPIILSSVISIVSSNKNHSPSPSPNSIDESIIIGVISAISALFLIFFCSIAIFTIYICCSVSSTCNRFKKSSQVLTRQEDLQYFEECKFISKVFQDNISLTESLRTIIEQEIGRESMIIKDNYKEDIHLKSNHEELATDSHTILDINKNESERELQGNPINNSEDCLHLTDSGYIDSDTFIVSDTSNLDYLSSKSYIDSNESAYISGSITESYIDSEPTNSSVDNGYIQSLDSFCMNV